MQSFPGRVLSSHEKDKDKTEIFRAFSNMPLVPLVLKAARAWLRRVGWTQSVRNLNATFKNEK